ncbi:acyl-CoA/acyl-ACP dehydrogenase [Cytobacillus suaedae]|nr:acyl-CoA/acyl-ACP dehydrogenase [Cytobacillus suaedae]
MLLYYTKEDIIFKVERRGHLNQPDTSSVPFKDLRKTAEGLSKRFQERANESSIDGDWLITNLDDLKEANFLALTVPTKFGGYGLNLYEFIQIQEILAQGDGATALSIGWHLGIILETSESCTWDPKLYEWLCKQIVNNKVLINAASSEKATGSPARGGLPTTKATKDGKDWIIKGEKSFTSMAIALDYALVTAQISDTGKKGIFLVDQKRAGVSVEETWDSISMKATKSDDLILDNVRVGQDALLVEEGASNVPKGWLLHIPAVYLGIALAARDYAVSFAYDYHPNSLPGPIIEVPEVQRKIGEMELELYKAKEILHSISQKWVSHPEMRVDMSHELGAVKHIVTNSANDVVDIAMRIVGARSLSEKNPLQRYFRDVRAGLHNPPADEIVIQQLAQRVIKNRG